MDDDTENRTADAFEETAEVGGIEDEFEILTMDSDESKTEPQAPKLKETTEENDEVNAFEMTFERTAEPQAPESDQNNAGKTIKEPKVVETQKESRGDKEDVGSRGAGAGNEDDEAWGWNSWTNWGTSVINTAASSVTTFTSQVGDGLIQVLETVESGLLTQDEEVEGKNELKEGPSDQPITDQNINPKVDRPMERGEEVEEGSSKDVSPSGISSGIASGKSWLLSSLSNVVSKTTSVVQQTTNVVVHGGLDMLETIGKKTYDVITEGDHGLKKVIEENKQKRQMPNLSQVLNEAREIADLKYREEESLLETKKFLYSYWFDEYQGLVQLEAFELLANQNEAWSRKEYDRLPKEKLIVVKKRLAELNEIYKTIDDESEDEEVDDKEDFNQLLLDYGAKLPFNISVQKLLECQESSRKWLDDHEDRKMSSEDGDKDPSLKDVLKKSMQFLAQLTALSIQHFHKLAQLITKTTSSMDSPLDDPSSSSISVTETARIVLEFSKVLRREFSVVSGKFATTIGRFESSEGTDSELSKEVSEHITSVYLEASNSTNFVQRSLKLLLPALQVAAMMDQ